MLCLPLSSVRRFQSGACTQIRQAHQLCTDSALHLRPTAKERLTWQTTQAHTHEGGTSGKQQAAGPAASGCHSLPGEGEPTLRGCAHGLQHADTPLVLHSSTMLRQLSIAPFLSSAHSLHRCAAANDKYSQVEGSGQWGTVQMSGGRVI